MKIALCIGHSRRIEHPGRMSTTNDGGAIAADNFTDEWSFNRSIGYLVKAKIPPCEHDIRVYDVYNGRSYTEAMTDVAKQVEAADLAVEIHFNAYNGKAQGREAFYWHNSTNGEEFARILLDVQGRFLVGEGVAFPMRGAKPASRDTRGSQFLRKTRPIAVLWEWGFGDNPEEWEFYRQNDDLLVSVLTAAIREWEPSMV